MLEIGVARSKAVEADGHHGTREACEWNAQAVDLRRRDATVDHGQRVAGLVDATHADPRVGAGTEDIEVDRGSGNLFPGGPLKSSCSLTPAAAQGAAYVRHCSCHVGAPPVLIAKIAHDGSC